MKFNRIKIIICIKKSNINTKINNIIYKDKYTLYLNYILFSRF